MTAMPNDFVEPVTTTAETEPDDTESELIASVPERFAVRDEGSANWVIRRIVGARAYRDRVRQWAVREEARAKREEEFFLRRFGPELQQYLDAGLKGERKRRSLNLPAGRIGYRRVGTKLVVDDENSVLTWAKAHCPDAVQVVQRLLRTPLAEHVTSTGEIPEAGVHIEPEHDSFYVS